MVKVQLREGSVRPISPELANAIEWNLPRGRGGERKDSDKIVLKACEMLVQGETVLLEIPVDNPQDPSAAIRANLIRARLGSARIQTTHLSTIQSEGLRESANSQNIPVIAVRLRLIEL